MKEEEISSYINKIKLLGAKKCSISADYWARNKIDIKEMYRLNDGLIAIFNCYGIPKIIKVDKDRLLNTIVKLRCLAYTDYCNEEVFYIHMNSIYTHDTIGCVMIVGFDNGNAVPLKMDHSYIKVMTTEEFGIVFLLYVQDLDLDEQYIITKDLKWYKIEETLDVYGENILHVVSSNKSDCIDTYKYEKFTGVLYGITTDTYVL